MQKDRESGVRDAKPAWFDEAQGGHAGMDRISRKANAAIMYVRKLSSDWSNFTGHIEWYNRNASVKFYAEDFSYDYMSGILGVYAVYPPGRKPENRLAQTGYLQGNYISLRRNFFLNQL